MNGDIRYMLRVHGSGVWLACELLEPVLPGTMRFRGRRAHSWQGAVDCSALARGGPGSGSRITDETEVSVSVVRLVEAQPMTEAALRATASVPVAVPS